MADEWALPQPKKPKPLWLRRSLWISGGCLLLLAGLYFFLTSAFFFKSFILPRVGSAINAAITIRDASISPFSSITIKGLKLTAGEDSEPLVTAKEVRARCSLMDIIGGHIKVDEVTLDSPAVQIVQNPDGTTNLDPLLKSSGEKKEAESRRPLQINLKKISLRNALVRLAKLRSDGRKELAELANLNIDLDNLRNGDTAKLTLSSGINLEQSSAGAPPNAARNLLQSELNGSFDIGLSDELKPQAVNGKLSIDAKRASGVFRSFAGVSATFDCLLTPTSLDNLLLTFTQDGKPLGQVSLKGPLDVNRREGRLTLEMSGIDRQALSLVGADAGIDFGSATISSIHEITFAQDGQMIAAKGNLNLNQLSVSRNNASSKPIDLQVDYETALNRNENSVVVKSLLINAAQNSVPLIRGALATPTTVSFGGEPSVGDAEFSLVVTNFNLGEWRGLVGDFSGSLNLAFNLLSQGAGKKLKVDLASQLAGFSAKFGSNQIDQADITISAKGELDDLAIARLSEYNFLFTRQKQTALMVSGSGTYDLKSKEGGVQMLAELSLPQLLGIVAEPEAQVSAGGLKINLQLSQKQSGAGKIPAQSFDQTVSGNLQLRSLSGSYAAFHFNEFESTMDLEMSKRDKHIEIRKLAGKLRQSGQAGGAFDVTGDFNLGALAGQATVVLTDLNQNALRTFAASALRDRTLTSVSISANTSVRFAAAAAGESSVRGNIQIANLLMVDPKGQWPGTPLAADFKLDGRLRNNEADIKEFGGNLRLADQPGGGFTASGKYDLKKHTGQGALKLTGLNQNLLHPFIAPALGDKKLSSVSVFADTTAVYDANGDSSLKGEIVITNLLVMDHTGKLPRTPLAVGLHFDGAYGKQVLNLRRFQLNLSPTDRAKNEMVLSGRVDLNQPKAISGEMQLRAEALDLTPYYDLLAAPSGTNTAKHIATGGKDKPASASAKTTAAPVPHLTEPAPVELPFQNFNFALSIDLLYLREIAITDWLVKAKLDGGKINLKPFDLVLNGGPVKTSVNLDRGVPGYQYDLAVSAERIPLEPIVNTFQPEKRGEVKGDLMVSAQVKGSGITGVNLRKTLAGQLGFTVTKTSLKIGSPRANEFFMPIGFLLGIPTLVSSPLNSVSATARMGNGKINLTQFNATSDSFLADTAGEITIADDLMNSPIQKWPLHLSVPRTTAERLRMVPKNAPPDSAFVKLPDLVQIAGTLGEPKAEIDKRSLSSAALRKLTDQVPGGKNPLDLLLK